METNITQRMLAVGTLLVLVAVGISPASGEDVVANATEQQACADYKGENHGFGGDKYTECNGKPETDSGPGVRFVCAGPSTLALDVEANDLDADAKGRVYCGGEQVLHCQARIVCEDADAWDGPGSPGTRYDGSCQGGTEEFGDSGMAWSCVSVGAGVCRDECDVGDAVEEARRRAQQLVDEITNQTSSLGSDAEAALQIAENVANWIAATADDAAYTLYGLAVGILDGAGNGFGIVCGKNLCEPVPVECDIHDKNNPCVQF